MGKQRHLQVWNGSVLEGGGTFTGTVVWLTAAVATSSDHCLVEEKPQRRQLHRGKKKVSESEGERTEEETEKRSA